MSMVDTISVSLFYANRASLITNDGRDGEISECELLKYCFV